MLTAKPATMPVQYLSGRIVGCSLPLRRNFDEIHRRFYNFPTKSQTSESVLLRSADSNPNKPIAKEKEMSGSDVLWAIQRATAQRKRSNTDRRKKKKIAGVELSSSTGESSGDNGVDYSNVRPLRIKSDWGNRLEEFEKLLKEFQDTEL